MKKQNILKTDLSVQNGFSHIVLPLIIVVAVAIFGTYMLVFSSASTATRNCLGSSAAVYNKDEYTDSKLGRTKWSVDRGAVYYAGNWCLRSTDYPHWRLVWQPDGNLVIYTSANGPAHWASNTAGKGKYLNFRTDGKVTITNSERTKVYWSTDNSNIKPDRTLFKFEIFHGYSNSLRSQAPILNLWASVSNSSGGTSGYRVWYYNPKP